MKNDQIAIALVNAGANINAVSPKPRGGNLLSQAISNQMFALAKLLIQKGAGVDGGTAENRVPSKETNPLYQAFLIPEPHRNELISLLLQNNANPNLRLDNSSSVLFCITEKATSTKPEDVNIIKLLCEKGADVHAKNSFGKSPLDLIDGVPGKGEILAVFNEYRKDVPFLNQQLTQAVESKKRDLILKWIAKGAEIDHLGQDGKTNLYRVFMKGDHDLAQFLVQNNSKVALSGLPTASELIEKEIFQGPVLTNMVNFLLSNGTSPNSLDKYGRPLISVAVMVGNADIVQLLINKGATVDPAQKINDMGPLMLAVNFRHEAIARMLITAKANVNEINRSTGFSILSRAMELGLYPLAEHLLNSGARPNVGTCGANNPLIQAISADNLDFVKLLIGKGADVNFVLADKSTALIAAIRTGNISIIEWLLINKANIDTKDGFGESPMSYAIDAGRQDIVKLLLKYGANQEKIG
jgi:ankyrin repeat protein